MATIDKNKFQFVKRDDFASEVIDAPAYSYWKSVFRQFLKKRTTIINACYFDWDSLDEFCLSYVFKF